jgi:hypothetical protein
MEIYSIEINSIIYKTFKTENDANLFIAQNIELYDKITLWLEEYPDNEHASDAHGYKTKIKEFYKTK